jgi:hypothetical protein
VSDLVDDECLGVLPAPPPVLAHLLQQLRRRCGLRVTKKKKRGVESNKEEGLRVREKKKRSQSNKEEEEKSKK